MWHRLFPKQLDNAYRGHWLAIPILIVTAGMKGWQGVLFMVATSDAMSGGDGIPVANYSAAAQDTMVLLAVLLGLQVVIIALLCGLALIRYRTMIPLMYLALLASQIGSRIAITLYPIARIAHPELGFAGHPVGFWANLVIVSLTVAGFVLSLVSRSSSPRAALQANVR